MWASVKRKLRDIGARTKEALNTAITEVLSEVSTEEVRGWCRHCGYCTEGL